MAYPYSFALPGVPYHPLAPVGHAEGNILWVILSDGTLRPIMRDNSFVPAPAPAPDPDPPVATATAVTKAIEAAAKAKVVADKAKKAAEKAEKRWAEMVKKEAERVKVRFYMLPRADGDDAWR